MEVVKIYFKNKEYYIDTNKALQYADIIEKIKPNEKSIFKILKKRKLLDEVFLNAVSANKTTV